jgi:hypothetical protein
MEIDHRSLAFKGRDIYLARGRLMRRSASPVMSQPIWQPLIIRSLAGNLIPGGQLWGWFSASAASRQMHEIIAAQRQSTHPAQAITDSKIRKGMFAGWVGIAAGLQSIERLAFWMRSNDSRASVMAADKLLDRGWGKPSQDLKLQGELLPGLAEIVRQARERAIAVDAKPIVEHHRPIKADDPVRKD